MKLADGTILKEQSIDIFENIISISLITDSVDSIKKIFTDPEKTKSIETDRGLFNDYTILKSMYFTYEDDVYNGTIELEYAGLSKEVDDLKKELELMDEALMDICNTVYGDE